MLLAQDAFENLEEAEELAEQAIDAAEKDGDFEEAETQKEVRSARVPALHLSYPRAPARHSLLLPRCSGA